MQDLIEAYMSVYDDINEVKGFGGRVDPKTGKYTGEVSSPSQKVFQQFSNDSQTSGGRATSSARSKSITHNEPKESGVVRSRARGVDVTKQDPGLAMTPAKRMETRANALRLRGQGKRANKIDSVRNRPNMEESYMEIDEKRLVPGTPDRAHKFPLTPEELNLVGEIGKHRERMEQELASSRTKSRRRNPNPTQTPPSSRPTSIGNTNKSGDVWTADQKNEDFYNIVLDYLLDEGYCKSEENAISMMAAMSEDWIDSIING